MVRALWDSFTNSKVPDFLESPYDLGSFDELVHDGGEDSQRRNTFDAGFYLDDSNCSFEIEFGKNGSVAIPIRRRVSRDEAWIQDSIGSDDQWKIRFGSENGEWEWNLSTVPVIGKTLTKETELEFLDTTLGYFVTLGLLPNLSIFNGAPNGTLAVEGSSLPSSEDWNKIRQVSSAFMETSSKLRQGSRPYSSAPVRSRPLRTYEPTREVSDPEGINTVMVLAGLVRRFPKESRQNKCA